METAKSFGIAEERAVNYHSDSKGTQLNYQVLSEAICAVRCSQPLSANWKKRIDEDYKKRDIRELIINAVMNCSFLQPSHIQVAVYDNRLEITSPGGLMPGVTIERMKEGYSQIRNRALAHAFSYMNLIEGWGTGIPRLLREMKEYGLPEPEFVDMEIALRINLYRTEGTAAENALKVPESAGECRRTVRSTEKNLSNNCKKWDHYFCGSGSATGCETTQSEDNSENDDRKWHNL